MPGFNDIEAITVFPADKGSAFRVPAVEAGAGFDIRLEAEAGNGVIGPPANTPYQVSLLVRNLTQNAAVVTAAPVNATGNIGPGQTWNTNDQLFVFTVAGGAVQPNDFLEVLATVTAGAPPGATTGDFSTVRSDAFLAI